MRVQKMLSPRDAIAVYRAKLEALKNGEGIPDCNRADPETMRGHFHAIKRYIDRAEQELDRLTPENLDFFHCLMHAAEYRTLIAFNLPMIMRDEVKIAGTRKNRRGRWPILDDWVSEQGDMTAKQLWERLPDSYDGDTFYRDGDKLIERDTERTLTFSGFEKRVGKVKKKATPVNN